MKATSTAKSTFHLLTLLITYIPRHLHIITHEGTTKRMMYRSFHRTLILDNVHRKPCTLRKRAVLVVDRLDLNGIQGDERGLSGPLCAHILDTVDGGLFFINDDRGDVAPENNRDCSFILALDGLAEIDNSAADAWNDQVRKSDGR